MSLPAILQPSETKWTRRSLPSGGASITLRRPSSWPLALWAVFSAWIVLARPPAGYPRWLLVPGVALFLFAAFHLIVQELQRPEKWTLGENLLRMHPRLVWRLPPQTLTDRRLLIGYARGDLGREYALQIADAVAAPGAAASILTLYTSPRKDRVQDLAATVAAWTGWEVADTT